jgi:hypothetical protein
VFAHVVPVERQRAGRSVELVEVPLEELIHGGLDPWVATLLDLTDQAVASSSGATLRPWSSWDDLGEVVPPLRQSVDAAINPDSQRPAR